MPLAASITGVENLKSRSAVARLLAWNSGAVQDARFDREELTIDVDKAFIREACAQLRDSEDTRFNFLSDLTCVDRYPSDPRFEVIYHLLSHGRKERVRLKVKLMGDDAVVESIYS